MNLINEIINTAARDKSDVQYIKVDGSMGQNFGLLMIDELTRRGFTTGTGNSRENKVNRAEGSQQIFNSIEFNRLEMIEQDLRKNGQ